MKLLCTCLWLLITVLFVAVTGKCKILTIVPNHYKKYKLVVSAHPPEYMWRELFCLNSSLLLLSLLVAAICLSSCLRVQDLQKKVDLLQTEVKLCKDQLQEKVMECGRLQGEKTKLEFELAERRRTTAVRTFRHWLHVR